MKKAEIILRKQARKAGYKGKKLLEFIKNPIIQEIKAEAKRGRPKKNANN
mgnify:CR=1 FL=1